MHVVVLAYGPSQLTKQAVRRARKLAGAGSEVWAVAASPVGVDAVASLPGAKTVPGYGGTALQSVLEQVPDEPTLLIHDDIVITTKGVLALDRTLAGPSRFAIPYSNDPNMDNFIGSLPAGKAAEKMLDQIPIPDEAAPAARIRPTCVAAKTSDLATLLTDPIVDPYASITPTNMTIAANAVAAHSTSCVHQLIETPAMDRPLLVAALIVKNEEEMLPGCLESLQGVCDRIEVCDTGSTDNTIDIARAAGAGVSERDWNDDFGAARNHALDQCRDARYALVIDADERLICPNPENTRRYLATYAAEHPGFVLKVTNVDSDGDEQYSFTSVRIFHAADHEYRGSLHEVVYHATGERALVGDHFSQMRIQHHGYDQQIVEDRNKVERNLTIARAQYESRNDAHSAIHLARSLAQADQDPEQAIALLEDGLQHAETPATQGHIKGLLADRYLAVEKHREAFDVAREALQVVPGDDTALAMLAVASAELGNPEEFIEIAEQFGNGELRNQALHSDTNRRVFKDQLIGAYAVVGDAESAVAAAFELLAEEPTALTTWPHLIDCLNGHFGGASLDLLVPLTVKDATGGFLEPLIKTYPSGTVADFCATYVRAGGALPEATRIGLLAAAMSSNDRAFASLTPSAQKLETTARNKLADRITESGRPDLAEQLRDRRAVG